MLESTRDERLLVKGFLVGPRPYASKLDFEFLSSMPKPKQYQHSQASSLNCLRPSSSIFVLFGVSFGIHLLN